MPSDKTLYDLYIKEMKSTGVQVNKKLASFTNSFANRVINEPNIDIEKIYAQQVKKFGIIDDVATTIQGGMINQTAIGYGIMPEFSASLMAGDSTEDLVKIFGKTKGRSLSKSVYKSTIDSQQTVYNTIAKNAKELRTWKETSKEIAKTLNGNIKGYENLPKHIKELERVGIKTLNGDDKRKFKKALGNSRKEIEKLSVNRALKKNYSSAISRLDSAIAKNDKVLFEKAIKQVVFDKNKSLAERTVITEQSQVFEQTRFNSRVDNPLITAIMFNLSSCHTIVDQCDVIADFDSDLGTGVYSLSQQPSMPIHANGVSFLTEVTKDVVSQAQADSFKYKNRDIANAGKKAKLCPSQLNSLKDMQFMKTVRVDKEYLKQIVTK